MESKTYFDQPYAKITWISEGNCLHVVWRSSTSNENYQRVADIQKQVIRKHGCTKLVFNTQALRNNISQLDGSSYHPN